MYFRTMEKRRAGNRSQKSASVFGCFATSSRKRGYGYFMQRNEKEGGKFWEICPRNTLDKAYFFGFFSFY